MDINTKLKQDQKEFNLTEAIAGDFLHECGGKLPAWDNNLVCQMPDGSMLMCLCLKLEKVL